VPQKAAWTGKRGVTGGYATYLSPNLCRLLTRLSKREGKGGENDHILMTVNTFTQLLFVMVSEVGKEGRIVEKFIVSSKKNFSGSRQAQKHLKHMLAQGRHFKKGDREPQPKAKVRPTARRPRERVKIVSS